MLYYNPLQKKKKVCLKKKNERKEEKEGMTKEITSIFLSSFTNNCKTSQKFERKENGKKGRKIKYEIR